MNQWINRLRGQFKASFLYKTIDSMTLFQMFVLIVIVAKIVRWTVMYGNQVVYGVGHFWINNLKDGDVAFHLFSVEDEGLSAGGNAVYVFHLLDFFHLQTYTTWEIYVSILSDVIVMVFMLRLKRSIRVYQWLIVVMTIAVLNIFSFCLAKEPVQMLYFMSIALVLLTDWGYILKTTAIYLCLLISMMTFRTYYILILMYVIMAQVVFEGVIKKVSGLPKRLFVLLLGIFVYGLIFFVIVYNVSPENYQIIYDARVHSRSIEMANTGIKNWLDTESWLMFTLNWVVVMLRLLLPLELIFMGPKYWLFVIYQLMITLLLIRSIKRLHVNKQSVNLATYVFVGFLLGSALFEPDFGSWVRHESVAFGVTFIMGELIGIKETKRTIRRIVID